MRALVFFVAKIAIKRQHTHDDSPHNNEAVLELMELICLSLGLAKLRAGSYNLASVGGEMDRAKMFGGTNEPEETSFRYWVPLEHSFQARVGVGRSRRGQPKEPRIPTLYRPSSLTSSRTIYDRCPMRTQ